MSEQTGTPEKIIIIINIISFHQLISIVLFFFCNGLVKSRGGGGGDSNIKKVGVLVVSLRGANFRFWSRLGC